MFFRRSCFLFKLFDDRKFGCDGNRGNFLQMPGKEGFRFFFFWSNFLKTKPKEPNKNQILKSSVSAFTFAMPFSTLAEIKSGSMR